MTSKPKFSSSEPVINWIRQFDINDQATAIDLVDGMMLVSYDSFFNKLRDLILERSQNYAGPIGLYAEREIKKHNGTPNRLFKETSTKIKRAFGAGPRPVQPLRTLGAEVGSEGLVAQLVSEILRGNRLKFRTHPGPDEIRRLNIHTFFLITDFIGSGTRAKDYLEAAWKIASVRSWSSLGLMRFEVISYSATCGGRALVENHRSQPFVSVVAPCPTVDEHFSQDTSAQIRKLCERYSPRKDANSDPMGYSGTGALIAFSHGCPNNVPLLLRESGKSRLTPWKPLFPSGTTSDTRPFFDDKQDLNSRVKRLQRLNEPRLAKSIQNLAATNEGLRMIEVLAALKRGPRFDEVVARRTGLTLPEVRILIEKAFQQGWVQKDRLLTDAGHSELAHIRAMRGPSGALASEPDIEYCPKALRSPRLV